VVDKIRSLNMWVSVSTDASGKMMWICEWHSWNDLSPVETAVDYVMADTAPLAICRAALLAVMEVG